MSLNSIALSIGATVGAEFGRLMLISYGYWGLGALGLLSVAATALYTVMVVDPFRP
jgi:predicted MFS family arabinose efflux permease